MSLSPEEIAAVNAKAASLGIGDAGAPAGGAPPPPQAIAGLPTEAAPSMNLDVGPQPGAPPPGTRFALPPDVAARAAQQNLLGSPAQGPAPHKPGDSVASSGSNAPLPGSAAPAAAAPTGTSTSSTATTTQSGVPFSAATQQARASLAQQQAAATADAPGLQKEQQAAQNLRAATQDQYAATMQQNAAEAKTEAEGHEAALAPMKVEIRDAQDALAKRQADPDHFWHSRSTGQKVSLVLAQAAGAFGAALSHTPNEAAESIRSAVDRDIHAQEANIAKGQKDLENKVGQYNLQAGTFKTAEEKNAAARALKLSAVGQQIQNAVDAEEDPLKRAKLQAVGLENAKNVAEAQAKLDELAAGKKSTTTHSTYSSGGGAGAGAGAGGLPADRVVRGPDGKMYLAPDAKKADDLREQQATAKRLQTNIARAKALRDSGGQIPLTDAKTQLGVTLADIRRDYLALNKKRLPPAQLEAQMDNAIGSPDSLFDWHGGTRLDALNASVGQAVQDDYVAYGATPLDEGSLAIQGGKPVITGTGIPTLAAPKGGKK